MDISEKMLPVTFIIVGTGAVIRGIKFFCNEKNKSNTNDRNKNKLFLVGGILFVIGGVIDWVY